MLTINSNSSVLINKSRMIVGPNLHGSILFAGSTSSYLTISNDIDFRFRTGDFTVEWFQYQTDNNSYPRPWTLGSWPNSNIGVSIESGNLLFWYDGSTGDNIYNDFGSLGTYKNMWVHLAVTRIGGNVRVFKNGTQIGSDFSLTYDFNDSGSLLGLGGEPNHQYQVGCFGGYITNFRWIKGECLYSSNFQVPVRPLESVTGTKLLLLASKRETAWNDSSGLNKTVTQSNTLWDSESPFI